MRWVSFRGRGGLWVKECSEFAGGKGVESGVNKHVVVWAPGVA